MESENLEREFEDDILKSSTPRLRLIEAQVLDEVSSNEQKNVMEEESEAIETILQNPEQV